MNKTIRQWGRTYDVVLALARGRGRITVSDLEDGRTTGQRGALLRAMTLGGHLVRVHLGRSGWRSEHSVYAPVLGADGKPYRTKSRKGT